MSNTNNNLQTQTSNALHNAIMEAGGKDRHPMLAPDKMETKDAVSSYDLKNFGGVPTFKRTFSQDMDLLEKHLTKEILYRIDCKTALIKLRTMFENTFNSKLKERIQKYTVFDAQSFKDTMIGADNRPPLLEKDMYDYWKSRMELYMMNRQHGRMILESVKNGPLIWPSIEENRVARPKKYSELFATEAIQADCDIKATNIILQGLPPEVYALVSNHKVAKELWERIQLLMQGTSLKKQERECKLYDEFDKFAYKKGETLFNQPDSDLIVPVFQTGDDPIDSINHMMSFLTAVVTSRYPTTNNQLRNSSNPRQQATINDGRVTLQPIQGRQTSFYAGTTRTNTSGASGSNSGK
ncbi:hypothetical protein Tco_0341578 [Tanacetum coccineum]